MMDPNETKWTAQWFYENLYRDEVIEPRTEEPEEYVPTLIRTARSLENGMDGAWQSRESIFVKQAKLLAAYEDDYPFEGSVVCYFPTYQTLNNRELRGYFTWRTKLRSGDIQKTSKSFAFLYIYELINQIGVKFPMEGYQKLAAFREAYGKLDKTILTYLDRWLVDYVVYYGLDPNLLADTPQVRFDRSITILEHVNTQNTEKVMYAVKELSPRWLERSKFYSAYREDCDAVIVRVLRRMADHYAKHCKKSMVEQYFGTCGDFHVRIFDSAVFCDPMKKRSCEYAVDERCVYRCKNGFWTVHRHPLPTRPNAKLADLLKTIDAVMRQEYDYRHPIQTEMNIKWLVKITQEETRALLAEKKAEEEKKKAEEAKKITIDYEMLSRIRQDAAVTRDKLIVDEELEEEPALPTAPPAQPEPAPQNDTPLDAAEYRLMQCLLYGRDLGWVQAEGHILSVLLDSINDKLYDDFLDAVLDDTPAPVEDYIDDLKEMVKP